MEERSNMVVGVEDGEGLRFYVICGELTGATTL